MQHAQIKALFVEIVDFLAASEGAYKRIDGDTYRDIIDALLAGRYRIIRDSAGSVITFTTWWLIHERDIGLVKGGNRPGDIDGGTIVYVADHAGKGGYPELIRFIRSTIGKKGVCWHHRYKQPEQFRYYPDKKGAAHG